MYNRELIFLYKFILHCQKDQKQQNLFAINKVIRLCVFITFLSDQFTHSL